MTTAGQAGLVLAAGVGAGAVNAIAGGGTLLSFPALLAVGVDAKVANITSSVGLLTGYAGGSLAYRRELAGQRSRVRDLGLVSVLGGITGAVLLLLTPTSAFRAAVPWLILASCALLAAQPRLAALVAARRGRDGEPTDAGLGAGVRLGVLVGAVYGSYFGAGLGVLLLGVLGILVHDHLQRLNALKGLLSLVINVVGVLVFLASGQVDWLDAGLLAVGAYLGGVLGVRVARLLSPGVLRFSVVTLGAGVALALLVTG